MRKAIVMRRAEQEFAAARSEYVAALVDKLTVAQREFICSLPADGTWRETTAAEISKHGKNALCGFGKSGLVEGYYREVMRHRLTQDGLAVRGYINGETK